MNPYEEIADIFHIIGNFLSILIMFFVTKVPDIVLSHNYFDRNLAGYDLIRYAFICIVWIIFIVFLSIQFIRIPKIFAAFQRKKQR